MPTTLISTNIGVAVAAIAAGLLSIASSTPVTGANRPAPDVESCAASDEWLCESRRPPAATADAEQIASRFIDARDSWDGDTARSLIADDAVIYDFAITGADGYLANSELERIFEWRFQLRLCSVTAVGPPASVTCTYDMRNALSEALAVGPFNGSHFEFIVDNGLIQRVRHFVDYSLYEPQVVDVFWDWLDETHPGDSGVIFLTTGDGMAHRNTTPEALDLARQRIPEFVSSVSSDPSNPAADPVDGSGTECVLPRPSRTALCPV
jgi:hypothetical protein